MKLKLTLLFIFTCALVKAQSITPSEAKNHAGENLTVCGKVYDVFHYTKGKAQPTFINFGAAYPVHSFTALVWGTERQSFSFRLETLENQNVCVTGYIKMYKGKPEMIIKRETQIKIQ